jgi:RHS repeat-associated protein
MRPSYLTCTRSWTYLNASRYSLAMLDPAPSCQPANGHGARPGGVRGFASSRRVSPGLTRPRRGGRIKNPERCQCGGLFVPVRPCAIPRVVTPRGFDLSGTLDGAGGIGGLLARSRHATSSPYAVNGNSFYHADGNGNVTYLASSSGGTGAAYRYDPFGRWWAQTGPYASANGWRFSSKPWVAHNGSNTDGLYYYGYRFYDPLTQRWLNRDPIEEQGGLNLYGFVGNDAISRIDPFGLTPPVDSPRWPPIPSGPAAPRCPVQEDWSGDNNCMNYACDRPWQKGFPPRMTPGGRPYTCESIKAVMIGAGSKDVKEGCPCPDGYIKVRYYAHPEGFDFHFRRQEDDGKWSEKIGMLEKPRHCKPGAPHKPPGDSEPYKYCGELCIPGPDTLR